ncbi:MAG: hypothetical protein R3185_06740, partial [Candidatus Thermoplasmatota archaeon]|nr:hypothetical protein [Candidatus Thermoplasmatota archaeon]
MEVPCKWIGFEPPPGLTHLRFLTTAEGWRLLMRSMEPDRDRVLRWLSQHGAFHLRDKPGIHPRVLVLEFARAPPAWQALLNNFQVHLLVLEPDGTATLTLGGSRD